MLLQDLNLSVSEQIRLNHVSFEQAVKLEEIGLPPQENSLYVYVYDGRVEFAHYKYLSELYRIEKTPKEAYCAPTYEIVKNWLFEKKGWLIAVLYLRDKHNYYAFLSNTLTKDNVVDVGTFDSYNEAFSAAIDKTIDILKEQTK